MTQLAAEQKLEGPPDLHQMGSLQSQLANKLMIQAYIASPVWQTHLSLNPLLTDQG